MKKNVRILVCRPDRIGDVILSTPLIRELKKTYPDSLLATLTNPYSKDVLIGNPNINELILDDPSDPDKYNFWDQVKRIRKFKFDIALLLLPTERLAWMLFGAGIPRRIGVGTKLYQILTLMQSVSRKKYIPLRHEADYCMDLGRKIGVTPGSLNPEIYIDQTEKDYIKNRVLKGILEKQERKNLKFVCIHPGSNQSSPNWSIDKYLELIQKILEINNIFIFITGVESEMHFVPKIKKIDSDRIINQIGKVTLRQLCGLISQMDALISSSTGPMHIAAALKVPTVSLFCPLPACSPTLWGPLGNVSKIMMPEISYCNEFCRNDPHSCKLDSGISVEEVFKKFLEIIEN